MAGTNRSIFDDPHTFLETGRALLDKGMGSKALSLFAKLRAERPGDPLLAALAAQLLTRKVPGFHAPMIAARAGAASVVACERDPMLAQTAREIVAANGLNGKVTVLALHSRQLERERDLAGGVDLVISEIFSDDLLGEQVLASLEHARAELCRPGARFLPAAASIRLALADFPDKRVELGEIEGLDLSLFARHVPRVRKVRPSSRKLVLRSEPVDLFRFSFDDGRAPPATGQAHARLRSSG